jgi:hypothetical protein
MTDKTEVADALMEDDPGIYLDLLAERDRAMERYEAVHSENRRLRAQIQHLRAELRTCQETLTACLETT